MTDADVLSDIKVALATLNGKVDTMTERMEAGDRQSAQLVTLVKDQLVYQAADLAELKAVVRENNSKADAAATAVRVDLERQIRDLRNDLNDAIKALTTSVNELKQWRAKLVGFGVGVAALSSTATAVVMKVLGA